MMMIYLVPIPWAFIFDSVDLSRDGDVEIQYSCSANASDNSVWWLPK